MVLKIQSIDNHNFARETEKNKDVAESFDWPLDERISIAIFLDRKKVAFFIRNSLVIIFNLLHGLQRVKTKKFAHTHFIFAVTDK